MSDSIPPDYLITHPAPPGGVSYTIRPDAAPPRKPLTREQATALVRKYNPDITTAAVQGEVDNIMRESAGDPTRPGDEGTSAGLYQDHLSRLAGLKEFAAKEKANWKDPDVQVRYARLEKERDYPALLKFQQTTDDAAAANEQFKRVFERPASVMWAHDENGQPITASPRFQFSDYAMNDAKRRYGADNIYYMSPGEYLDLSPELEGKPFESAAGRSLTRSVDRGDQIESLPTLDTTADGPTATVTDQDGRHRALLAQQEGIGAMPVAIRQSGDGTPTEIVGQTGNIMAHDFPRLAGYQAPQSVLGRMAGALIPSAEAAEPASPDWWHPAASPATTPDWWRPATPAASADNAAVSFVKGAAEGFGEPVYGGEQLAGKAMEAVGVPGGTPLATDAEQRWAQEQKNAAPDAAAHPLASGVGEFLGSMILPGLIGARVGGMVGSGPLGVGGLQGGAAGLLTPSPDKDFWRDKALGLLIGAGAGIGGGTAMNALSRLVAPVLRPFVQKLIDEGIELTPGMMKGGIAKAVEDRATSIPITGDAIQAARRRAFEQFNRAAWNRVLEPIGEKMPDSVPMGREAADYVGSRLSAAYGRILPTVTVRADLSDPAFTKFMGDLSAATRDARVMLPDAQFGQFERFVRAQIEQKISNAGGTIDGDTVNGIDSMLGSEIRGYSRSQEHDARKLGGALEEVQAAFRNLVENQNPAQSAALRQVREGYANYVRVAKAAAMQGTASKEGIFSPAQLNAAVRAENNTTRKLGYARGKALLQDLSDAGQAVLPSQYPDSGTAGRLLLGGGTFGLAELLGHPEALLGLAGISAPYIAPVSKAINWAVNRLAQPAGPARAALSNALRLGGQIAPPIAGSAAAARFTHSPQQ